MLFPFFAHAQTPTHAPRSVSAARKKTHALFCQSLCECVCAKWLERAIPFFLACKNPRVMHNTDKRSFSPSRIGERGLLWGETTRGYTAAAAPRRKCNPLPEEEPDDVCVQLQSDGGNEKFNCTCTGAQVAARGDDSRLLWVEEPHYTHTQKKNHFLFSALIQLSQDVVVVEECV